MPHERGEGVDVGFEARFAEGRERKQWSAVGLGGERKALGIALDPLGRVAGAAVFPGAKPEEHEMEIVGAGAFEEGIDLGVVEDFFGGL